jgi:hypothetical protein
LGRIGVLVLVEEVQIGRARHYPIGKGGDPVKARAAAEIADIPLSVTRRGALAFARKR